MLILFNLDDCLACITNKSSKLFEEALDNEFRPYHITRSQWTAMYYIYNNERITQKELADKMSIKEPSVVRLIQKMESEGFLYRLESVKDKRIKQLELSPKGEKGYHELLPIAENFKNYVVEGIPEEDLEIFKQVLETMTKNAVKE
ncbi:MarR family winged helix-turn-helix transcriptional regulator [Paraliobacillus salinarum]|uniref:MarR family winged helix-turn-helix transcriptional regulator n=1 Tax=Paraliobacillus salinarum TaxID=1158996 RepID=UPI0024841867|nr:MarR family transcriptional regulator [Paraliobacillus salinarum]